MRRVLVVLGVLAGSGVCAGVVAAQAPTVSGGAASARALGLGGAFVLGSPDADALFYNLAAGSPRGFALGARRGHVTMAAATEWWGGIVGAGVAGASGDPSSSIGALVGYGRGVGPVRAALGGRLVDAEGVGGGSSSFGLGLDASAAVEVADVVWVGASAQGLGVESIGEVDLERRLTLGAATDAAPVGPLDLLAAASVGHSEGDVWDAGGGVELSYWPVPGRTVSVRIGARSADFDVTGYTVGAGFAGDDIVLTWGFDELTERHHIGLAWR